MSLIAAHRRRPSSAAKSSEPEDGNGDYAHDHDDEPELTADEFWEELDDVVSTPCRTHDRIDDTLRTWISLAAKFSGEHVASEEDINLCANRLLRGPLCARHGDYIRRQLVHGLLQEDDPLVIHLLSAFLALDGRRSDVSLELLAQEGGFARLVELIRMGVDDNMGCHRQLLELVYEMCRIQRIPLADLATVNEDFVLYLFGILESLSGDVHDPHHNPVIRVLLVLNEQYMLAAHGSGDSHAGDDSRQVPNKVVKVLGSKGSSYKTFGESIILTLNRETETSLQLLILKIFYLLFTNPLTQEYFYTNDLHVLVDILIRNLLDLPPDATTGQGSMTTSSLRHTYLRVLYPLLANTQLAQPPHYKRLELRRMLVLLADSGTGHTHFDKPDETTLRLIGRCLSVDWLAQGPNIPSLRVSPQSSPSLDGESKDESRLAGHEVVARRLVGMSLDVPAEDLSFRHAGSSSLSINEIARQQARPGETTPSRRLAAQKQAAPPPPPVRVQSRPARPPLGQISSNDSVESATSGASQLSSDDESDDSDDASFPRAGGHSPFGD